MQHQSDDEESNERNDRFNRGGARKQEGQLGRADGSPRRSSIPRNPMKLPDDLPSIPNRWEERSDHSRSSTNAEADTPLEDKIVELNGKKLPSSTRRRSNSIAKGKEKDMAERNPSKDSKATAEKDKPAAPASFQKNGLRLGVEDNDSPRVPPTEKDSPGKDRPPRPVIPHYEFFSEYK